jgi:hypothetical protein
MPLLARYDSPAFLKDFDGLPNQHEGWSAYISQVFDTAISRIEQGSGGVGTGRSQFYNQTKVSPVTTLERKVVWNAFPRTLVRQFGRAQALAIADALAPAAGDGLEDILPNRQTRVQDEYCEWRVSRDPDTGKILRVTFTCEGPEWWQALAGGPSIYDENPPSSFGALGDRQKLVQLYRDLLGNQNVVEDDLFVSTQFGEIYNPWNKWNTTDGIVHLQQINNTLGAEITIGADATVLRQKGGLPVNDATRLICCSGYGGPERSSDPSLGFTVNRLAVEGRRLTLRNPVGIYMDSIDLSGFTRPNPTAGGPRLPIGDWWTVVRGVPDPAGAPGTGMIVRAVFEVPAGELGPDGKQLTVSDLQIGGIPINLGGQIAENITMKFVALAGPAGEQVNPALACRTKCCRQNSVLSIQRLSAPCPDVFPVAAPPGAMVAEVAAGPAALPRLAPTRGFVDTGDDVDGPAGCC